MSNIISKPKIALFSLVTIFFVGCGTEELANLAIDQYNKNKDSDDSSVIIPEADDIAAMIQRNNEIRGAVGVLVPLSWNTALAFSAQSHADTLAASGKLEHSQSGYGENIYTSFEQASYSDAVNAWFEENVYYDYESNSCIGGQECKYYTQLVWEATTEVGCGKASIGNQNSTVVVCHYNPPGNIEGELPY
ncbi:MAG: CAP domain-containing protein [Campylobacterota bacterium]|nr:CAP domain-containing protein [Campylobacterota bacterium]